MKKLIQNKVSTSRLTLPITIAYAICMWLVCGLLTRNLWLQFTCFGITSYFMMVLNNQNALIRIFSRMVSCAFLILSCAACFLMPSIREGIMQMFMAAAYLCLFQSYQNREAKGIVYYGSLMLGLASLACPHILYFVPLIWLLMGTNLLSLSWRTWLASLFGLLTPYWIASAWLVYKDDFAPLITHFTPLLDFHFPIRIADLDVGIQLIFGLLLICALTGIIHFVRKSSYDSIRIRLLYGFFIWMDLFAIALMVFMPQYYDMLLRIIIINTAPLIAHFLALTNTKITNAAFFVLTGLILFITVYNIWNT